MSLITVCGLLAGVGLLQLASRAAGGESPRVPVFTNQIKEPQPAKPSSPAANIDVAKPNRDTEEASLSPALKEIVKLTKAGVEESVIVAFVQSSRVAYHPSAQEVVKLRELGVSSAVITALLRRAAESPQPTIPSPPASQPEPQPAPKNQPTGAHYVPSPSPVTPPVVYASEPYYAWPGWYGYGGCYPGYYSGFYPRVAFYGGFYPGISVGLNFGGRIGFGHHHRW